MLRARSSVNCGPSRQASPTSMSNLYPSAPPAPSAPPPESVPFVARPRLLAVGRDPVQAVCNACQKDVITEVQFEWGAFTVCMALPFALFCLCCVPFCIPAFKDAVHYCPHCKGFIGKDKRL
uniref:LITAF domain-containing protein n=1 Tax=Panagrellus redivivus TaxID=6233 RepID=A0A7E4VNU7_PANRE